MEEKLREKKRGEGGEAGSVAQRRRVRE